MKTKITVISIYLVLVYWLSLHVPSLKSLFYPTLGAFSYLLVTRLLTVKESLSLLAGAVAASIIGTAFFFWLPEVVSLLATFVLCIGMIQRLKLNAPPILAIALIPFFAPPASIWTVPAAVFITLAILLSTLLLLDRISALSKKLPAESAPHSVPKQSL